MITVIPVVLLIVGMVTTLAGFLLTFAAFDNFISKIYSPDYDTGLIDMILLSVSMLQFIASAHFTAIYYKGFCDKK